MAPQYDPNRPFAIGTRGSPLALVQAEEARDRLMAAHDLPADAFTISVIKTTGDAVQDRPLTDIGGKGLFTKEIEAALLAGTIDCAVHSMKDVATILPDGLMIGTLLPREAVEDVFVSHRYERLEDLPANATFGTSSIRRRAQLLCRRPDLRMVEFRGNVQTRLQKLADGVADATLLARAGLRRLDRADLGTPVPASTLLPAVAQGAIGIEHRADDADAAALLAPLNDPATATELSAERAFLAKLDGSCRTPIAGLARIAGDRVAFQGEVLRPDGGQVLRVSRDGPAADAAALGADAADEVIAAGARTLF